MRAVTTKQPVNIRLIAEYLKFIKQKNNANRKPHQPTRKSS